jgi:hypothetical protein
MSRRRPNLAEFLLKPRFLHEIVENYKVSEKTAAFHLREAVKSGQVLVSEAPAFRTIRDSAGNLRNLSGFLYVHQKSPILVGKGTRLSMLKIGDFIPGLGNTSRVSFITKLHDASEKVMSDTGSTNRQPTERANSGNRGTKLRGNSSFMSKLNVSSARVASANNTRSSHLLSSEQHLNNKLKPFLNIEKIRLFHALLQEPLPFLDMHNRFNVSKQAITRLVKRGLLMETWGCNGVGVRFKLTSKGKAYLKELEQASNYKPKIRESPLTRLKQRSVA